MTVSHPPNVLRGSFRGSSRLDVSVLPGFGWTRGKLQAALNSVLPGYGETREEPTAVLNIVLAGFGGTRGELKAALNCVLPGLGGTRGELTAALNSVLSGFGGTRGELTAALNSVHSGRPDDLDSCNCYYAGADIKLLPCGGCSYCTRAQKVWSSFEDDVDYVVPLSVRSVSEQEEDLDETNLDSLVNCNWISESEITDMGAEQREDQELSRLIVWLEDKKEPEEHELYLCSPSIKHLWNCKHQLVLKDGILCYKWLDPVHSRLLLVVPRSLRHKILENCHDTKLSGHFGQAKTIERLKQNYIWYGLREDARNYVKSCHTCNVNKKPTSNQRGL
ncbi:Hypothetical predicted protein [Mytilus galloprovincialis]|uniref:Integrase zinc-binding domain-containing protein n=1 Tax=Mytilus galloprovincialis TaxID=29158 RepID=A0A8B6E933_MYTGA|nr:Hypothetical predicted protein [Mytilus galloprovincialis]